MRLTAELAMRPHFTCSDSMYLVRLLIRCVTMAGLFELTDERTGPQTGMSLDPCTFWVTSRIELITCIAGNLPPFF